MPDPILEAAKDCTLVIFVGAGVSRLMGCPSWNECAQAALRQLADDGAITYGDIQQLSHLDPKKRLSIALHISESASKRLNLETLILPRNTSESKIYQHLNSIGCAYVTTNYDRFLDEGPQSLKITSHAEQATIAPSTSDIICMPDQIKASCLRQPGAVVHLHGSLDVRESIVISTLDYLSRYENQHVQDFLKELFDRHTVLFIGYGLDEWEILEHILRKGLNERNISTRRYMLQGFYSHQQQTRAHLYEYYLNTYGVQLVPYSLDFLEHRQLEKITENWAGHIDVGRPVLSDDLDFVLRAADE